MTLDAHIVSHTHWDREWYRPAERFRQRLVALVDELLDDPPRPGESFLLDGQAIIVDDYLSVRPERAAELGEQLSAGTLEAGPWYVLADELIPSGEALVRNLLAGRRVLGRFGATSPPVLYCPDSFGHPAALPSIAAGFGLPLILVWRGYGSARWPAGDTARWTAPNGDDALLFHLPRDGYEFGSHLPADAGADERWQRMRAELVPRATTGVLLILNGADHHARQAGAREAIAALERAGTDDAVHRSSLRRFADDLVVRAAAQRLPLVRGELRDSYGYTWALQGTLATRAHEKRLNARVERLLVRESEPWSALAARERVSRRPLVEAAWRTALEAHPHDTLCGCSIDAVARAMELRLDSAHTQGAGIRDDAILDLIGHDPAAARESRDRWTPLVVVRNAAPRPRSRVAILEIEQFIADVPVGPGSAPSAPAPSDAPNRPIIPALGALQVLSRRVQHSLIESPRHYPDNDLVAVTRVAAWISEAPPYGLRCVPIGAGNARRVRPTDRVTVDGNTLRNGALLASVDETGRVSLEHMGRRIDSLIEFIDEHDAGDLYTPAPRPRDVRVEFRGARRMHRGPLRGELALRYRLADASGGSRRAIADLAVHLVLDAGSPFLRIVVSGDNRAENHRLRIFLRTDVAVAAVWADAAFGPVRREPIAVTDAESVIEAAPPTAPLHRYVSLFNEAVGLTVFSDGLAEYEARTGGETVAITLVRAVGELSRNDLPERPGHAGWPAPTPLAQCLGAFGAELAVMPHGPRLPATIGAIEQAADDVLLPLVGSTLRSALGTPAPVVGIELVGVGLAFSALKESEDGEWVALRCVNLRDDEVEGEWRLPFDAAEVRMARLDETIMSDLVTSGHVIRFRAPPRGIVTMLVR